MIKDILILQQREFEERLKDPFIQRAGGGGLHSNNLIHVIMGPRRSGKSTFAIHLLKKKGNFGYINFDDEQLTQLSDYDELISAMDEVYGKPKYLLLDEIQNLPRWELFVNRLQRQGRWLTITGSNSHLLSSELSTHLTGRYRSLTLFPFSFREFLEFAEKDQKKTSQEKLALFRRYLEEGGYPEPLVKNINRLEYLSALMLAILYKDIAQRYKIRSARGLERIYL